MNIQVDTKLMIFRQTFGNRVSYSTSISKKMRDGKYDHCYIYANFKKGVDIPDKTKILVKKGWLSFYSREDTNTGKINKVPTVFISEFEYINPNSTPSATIEENKDPYAEFANEVVIDDYDLPI